MSQKIPLQCPQCKSPLKPHWELSEKELKSIEYFGDKASPYHPCEQCGFEPKTKVGMVDVRLAMGPHHDLDAETKLVNDLVEWSKEMDFAGLVTTFIHERTNIPVQLKDIYIHNRLEGLHRGHLILERLHYATEKIGWKTPKRLSGRDLGVLLDIGCGSGSQLLQARTRATHLIGVDADMVELAMARRLMFDHRETKVELIAANAESLPLPDECCDTIMMRDAIEHLSDQPKSLMEAWRVLKPGGRFFFNSPNRYALWWPEPHVWLLWMGFMPRDWMESYTMWRKSMPYQGNRLLGWWELKSFIDRLTPRPNPLLMRGASPPGADLIFPLNWFGYVLKRNKFCNLPVIRWFAPEQMILLVKPEK